jgi:hypothetical protein
MVPSVIFSHPPIGTCGMTEEEAVAAFGRETLKIYRTKASSWGVETEKESRTVNKEASLSDNENSTERQTKHRGAMGGHGWGTQNLISAIRSLLSNLLSVNIQFTNMYFGKLSFVPSPTMNNYE